MILVIGGAYQGKLNYVLDRFNMTNADVFECSAEDAVMPEGKKVIYEIEKWILSLIKADADTTDALRRFMEDNGDAIVIANDISCGVVPVDDTLRKWREAVGRSLAGLSRASDEVIRLFCGIPTRIK